jgi:hypothetical protein
MNFDVPFSVIEKTNDMRLEDKSTEDVDAKVSMGAN